MEDDDLSAFLRAIQGSPYEFLFFVTVFTGLHQGEELGLTWDCVNFERNLLLVNKQHGKKKAPASIASAVRKMIIHGSWKYLTPS